MLPAISSENCYVVQNNVISPPPSAGYWDREKMQRIEAEFRRFIELKEKQSGDKT
jgi:hypothetical protein